MYPSEYNDFPHRARMPAFKRLLTGWLLLLCAGTAMAQAVVTVAAASNLKLALDEISVAYQRQTGTRVRIAYGSSGNFFRQIGQGAPFELFLSAAEDFVLRLAEQNLTVDRGALYAVGRIVLFLAKGSPLPAGAALDDIARALADGRLRRFAIANPEHAPYGRAAMQALRAVRLWDRIQPALVLGENVSQAAQFAASGSAEAGIFAYSLALAPAFARRRSSTLISRQLHEPLRQRMVLRARRARRRVPSTPICNSRLREPSSGATASGAGEG